MCCAVLCCAAQEVYSALEALVDDMAMRAGHASLIYESTATNLGKLLSCMVGGCCSAAAGQYKHCLLPAVAQLL